MTFFVKKIFFSFPLLERLLVQPGPEDGQGGRVLDLVAGALQGAVVVPGWVRGRGKGEKKKSHHRSHIWSHLAGKKNILKKKPVFADSYLRYHKIVAW